MFAKMTFQSDEEREEIAAAEYVLGVMEHDARRAFALKMEKSERLRRRVQNWDVMLAPLAENVLPVRPPDDLWRKIELRVHSVQAIKSARTRTVENWWNNVLLWRGLSLASLTAMTVLIALQFLPPHPQNMSSAIYVAELSGETSLVRMTTVYSEHEAVLKFKRTQGDPPEGRAFELWLIDSDNVAVSLGVLPGGTQGSVKIPAHLQQKMAHAVLAISDEPANGSPTGQPTGSVLATGKVLVM
jgi:anti-sigma-K factor RskA